MELDPQLDHRVIAMSGGAEMLAASFETMSSATLDVCFDLSVLPPGHLIYVPLLPQLMRGAGVMRDGRRVEYDEMEERLRSELLAYDANLASNPETGRAELCMELGASRPAEIDRGLDWMLASLRAPLLDESNIAHLGDLIDQRLGRLRTRMQGSEESWVDDPARAYRYQDDPLYLSASSFLTQAHQLLRLKWRLTPPDAAGLDYLDELARRGRGRDRQGLLALLEGASGEMQAEIAASLRATLPGIPDASIEADWAELCAELRRELATRPEAAFAEIRTALDLLARAENARLVLVSSTPTREAKLPVIEVFMEELAGKGEPAKRDHPGRRYIDERLAGRAGLDGRPVYVGLVNENTRNGTVVFTARLAEPWQADREAVLQALTGRLFGGGGGHGFFMRTWAAGLAYSNGFGYQENAGLASYYAERCPDVAETLRFVVGVLGDTELDGALEDYCMAGLFGRSRAAGSYESRARGMAADLVDGQGSEKERAFREQALELRRWGELMPDMKSRMAEVYGCVLPGYGAPLAESRDGVFFLIGPEEQFRSLESYVASVEGPPPVHRLYPRDFWLTEM